MKTYIDNNVKINGNDFTDYDRAIEYIGKIMKRNKSYIYQCDYCGKNCKHTPEFILPVIKSIETCAYGGHRGAKLATAVGSIMDNEQRDICPSCQKKLARLASLIPNVILTE
ncbi:hypothetical protein [Lacrimispora sp.]|uniref:hypothetical protein n=1 Tax=Lacrimispora sp. TaxID=2719234 RepID=UPI0028AB8A80|nr:hypothetical protein [Lacrimispora sp.]